MNIRQFASDTLLQMGANPKYNGYGYLLDAIEIGYNDPEKAEYTLKLLYPDIAKKHKCSIECVESSIRYVVHHISPKETSKGFICRFIEKAKLFLADPPKTIIVTPDSAELCAMVLDDLYNIFDHYKKNEGVNLRVDQVLTIIDIHRSVYLDVVNSGKNMELEKQPCNPV